MYGTETVDSDFGILQHLNNDELKTLLNDDNRMDEMIRDLPRVRNLEAEKEMMLTSNKSLAEFNLSREPRLRQEKQRLVTSYDTATQVISQADTSKKTLDELSQQHSLDTTLALLQTSAAQSEEETEAIAERFLEGSLEVEAYLEEFLGKRKVAHLKRIKADKLMDIVNRQNRQSVNANQGWPAAQGPYGNQPAARMPVPRQNYPPA